MSIYHVYEEGKKINHICRSEREWKEMVTGLNAAMDTADAPLSKIKVVRNDGKIVYEQEGGAV